MSNAKNIDKAKDLLRHDPRFSAPMPNDVQEAQAHALITIAEELVRLNEMVAIITMRPPPLR